MRREIFTQNQPSSLEAAARDLLATVDYLIRQAGLRFGELDAAQIAMLSDSSTTHLIHQAAPRFGQLDAGHIAMLTASADWLRRELRAKAREVA